MTSEPLFDTPAKRRLLALTLLVSPILGLMTGPFFLCWS